jgi:hypothetical protein
VNGGIDNSNTAPVTVAGAVITPISGGSIIINGQTLTPGAQTVLPNGQSISIGSGGSIIINGQTTVVTPAPAIVTPETFILTPAPTGTIVTPITVGGVVATPLSGGAIIISGTTFLPGEVTTLPNGQVISVAPGGTQIAVNGQTATLQNSNNGPSAIPIIFNGETITPLTSGIAIVGGQTLTPGEVVTLSDGHIISVGTSGIIVVDGTSTTLPIIVAGTTTGRLNTAIMSNSSSALSTSTKSVGGAIASGIGATKKADAASLYTGCQDNTFNVSVGILLGLIGFFIGF